MVTPLAESRWDAAACAHLLRRAGFGATPDELAAWTGLGLRGAVDRLVRWRQVPDTTENPDWAKPEPERMEQARSSRSLPEQERRKARREFRREEVRRIISLKAWWLRRMMTTPRPLQEKLTLFWHGHFATSFEKVRMAYFMWLQNDLFRRLGNGSYRRLLIEAGRDPAMLVWLDGAQNTRAAPNENYARELMELFTLGEGHYTEDDVKAAARGLTGWTIDRENQRARFVARRHDEGVVTYLGRRGRLTDEDVVDVLLTKERASVYLAGRLWTFFAGTRPDPEVVNGLAAVFRSSGHELQPLLTALFTAEAFYAPEVRGRAVKSPVEWMVGIAKMAGRTEFAPLLEAGLVGQLGQDLFAPPSVKGWDGGRAWISTNTLLLRLNAAKIFAYGGDARMIIPQGGRLAAFLASNPEATAPSGGATPPVQSPPEGTGAERRRRFTETVRRRIRNTPPIFDPAALAPPAERSDPAALAERLASVFCMGPPAPSLAGAAREALARAADGGLSDKELRGLFYLLMTRPEFQLS